MPRRQSEIALPNGPGGAGSAARRVKTAFCRFEVWLGFEFAGFEKCSGGVVGGTDGGARVVELGQCVIRSSFCCSSKCDDPGQGVGADRGDHGSHEGLPFGSVWFTVHVDEALVDAPGGSSAAALPNPVNPSIATTSMLSRPAPGGGR